MRRIAFVVLLAVAAPAAAQPVARGIVLDGARGPLAGAQVELLPVLRNYEQGRRRLEGRDPAPLAVTVTDTLGRFVVGGGKTGVFAVRVAAPGKVPIRFDPLPLVEDTELPPAVPPKDAGAKLLFRTAQGRAAPDLWVFAGSKEGELSLGGWRIAPRVGHTAPDGSLTLPRLDGEELQVHSFTREATEDVHDDVVGGELRISSVPSTARILRVVDGRGQPIAGVLVRLGEAAWPVGLTDDAGRIAIRVRDGGVPRLRLVNADGRQTVVRLTASTEETLTVTFADRVPLSGRVLREEDGRSLAGALVWSITEPGDFQLTDGEGRYRTTAAKTGVWLEAQAPERLPKRAALDPARLGVDRAPALALARAGAVAGRVVDTAGNAIAGAWVSAVSTAPKEPVLASALTGADGTFHLGGLKPGELYSFQAAKTAFLPAAREALVPVPGKGGPPLAIVLAPARAALGRVLDQKKHPVAGAQVRLSAAQTGAGPHESPRGPDAVSDARGRFTVAEIPSLALDVEVSKQGFARATVRNFKIPLGHGPVDLGTVTLRPGVLLSGVVINGQSRPIVGASVFHVAELRPPSDLVERLRDQAPDAVTGSDGRFALADLRQGEPAHLLVFAKGFLPVTVRGIHPPTATPLRIELAAGADLAGRIVDPEGAPVSGAEIALTWQPTLPGRDDIPTGRPVSKRASTNRDGQFRFTEMPAGKATLTASAAGFITLEDQPLVLPQAPGEEKEVVLQRGSTLEGRVVTTVGAPVAGVRVLAGAASGMSDDDGVFRVDGVRPGPLVVEAVHPHYKRFRQRIRIEEQVNHLDIELAAGTTVRGRVVDGSAQPVPAATAVLETVERNEVLAYQARTDADGLFTLEDVAAGRYRLRASANGFTDGELPQEVVVQREIVEGLEVVLGKGGAITGRVLGLETEELPQVTVSAMHEAGESRVAELDAAGNYALRDLRAGAWLLQASLLDGQRHARGRVLLAAGGEETRDLRFGDGLTLSGWVLYRNKPLGDAEVSIRGQHLAVERSVTTGSDGEFRFEDLDADTYWLGLRQMHEQVADNEMIELTTDRELTIRLERETVAGSVTDAASGKPVGAAVVALRHIAGDEGPEFVMADGTDASGAFAVERVPPGHYRMTINHAGYSPAEREIEVPDGRDLTGLEVELQSAQGLELSVRRASGGPPGLLRLRVISPSGAPIVTEIRPVGSDGKVRLSSVPAGSWVLLAASSNAALTAAQVAVPGETIDLVLPDAARIAVRVPALVTTDSIASLKIVGSDGSAFQTLDLAGNLEQQWQLIAGTAIVESVPAGSWVVTATAPDGRQWALPVTTDGRADVQIDLE
ncbi:MAG TPA: carboxypeptidase-like regulatory domain-containing protein [Thermoanaerobaculia bacterium]|nr:carboxypeptidase-like regulatory domain-containing protein [Thermoanaerobaculia bacterium]